MPSHIVSINLDGFSCACGWEGADANAHLREVMPTLPDPDDTPPPKTNPTEPVLGPVTNPDPPPFTPITG